MQKLLEKLPKIAIIPNFFKSLPETPGIYTYFKDGVVIYVGKAINIRKRVTSYFDLDLDTKTRKMVSSATHLSFIQVTSELEALLLEAKLIRSYMPHYNIEAKDDKHPLYIRITKEKFPRIVTARKTLENEENLAFYGPFPSSRSVYTVLKMLRRIFPYSDHKLGKRGCIYSHIGLCNPCPNEIELVTNSEERNAQIKLYSKNIRNIKSILDGKIDQVSKSLEKEMAALSKSENYEEALAVRNQLTHLEYITRPQISTEFYLENPNLYSDQRQKELNEFKNILVDNKIKIAKLERIECFDIAHLAGTNATASMVTFINGEADKSYYRHFKIKIAKGGDDYASMAEIALRRKNNFTSWGKPDLIIVDGGVGQVAEFSKTISEVPIVGIAKHPDRLIVNDYKVKLTGAALNLVVRMRDEAHRFARRYHHNLISKSIKNANNN
ncbi:MAG TPA: UvrB/UvrC motif-containing protein [Patescibacteria group bacterium]|nr:UvrB/UvrC motif-containing protein [Patescibacteria group bacterium]